MKWTVTLVVAEMNGTEETGNEVEMNWVSAGSEASALASVANILDEEFSNQPIHSYDRLRRPAARFPLPRIIRIVVTPAVLCGDIGPRESSSPCVLREGHKFDHKDDSNGTWLQ